MAKRMASVIKSDLMVLPYAMLITRLYKDVLTIQPYPTTNIHYLVDHVMVPLTEGRAHSLMVDGKRPHPQTTSSSSSSQSQVPEQNEVDLVDNFTLDLPVVAGTIYSKGRVPSSEVLLPPPRKLARTNIIDISSNESSPIQANNLILTTLTTTLALSLIPPNASQTLTPQPIEASPLAPQALLFSTLPSSPHPYLNPLDDLPPISMNPPPHPLDQSNKQTPLRIILMNSELSSTTNLSRRGNRLYAQTEPYMYQEKILEEIGQL
ncbi:hypothetical protein Tco_0674948 [Tanacetum coccineum]